MLQLIYIFFCFVRLAFWAHVLLSMFYFHFLLQPFGTCKAACYPTFCMWNVSDFQSEIDSTCLLLQARPNVAVLQSNLGNGLVQKLKGIKNVPASEIVKLYDVLQKSHLPNDLKTTLTDLLDEKAAGMETNSNNTVTSVSQKLDHVENYLTAGEQEALQRKSPWEGAAILSSRLRLLGVMSMKESTKKKAVGLLCWYEMQRGGQPPTHDSSYALAQHMLQSFQSSPTQTPLGAMTLQEYPMDPKELSPSHLQASYGDDKPCPQDCPGLANLMKFNLCVRSTCSKLTIVATQKAQQSQQLQKQQPAAASSMCSVDPMAYAFAQRVWNQFCKQGEEVLSQTEPKLTIFPKNHVPTKTGEKNAEAAALAVPETKRPSLPLTAPSTQVASEPQQSQATPVGQHVATLPALEDAKRSAEAKECKSLEDFENDVYDALKTKKTSKAKAKAKSAASVKQKGSMKRPASALGQGLQAAGADVSLGKGRKEKSKPDFQLGCSKCRGSRFGCAKCLNPNFMGKRMARAEWRAANSKKNGKKNK